jgi:hypothetical protein
LSLLLERILLCVLVIWDDFSFRPCNINRILIFVSIIWMNFVFHPYNLPSQHLLNTLMQVVYSTYVNWHSLILNCRMDIKKNQLMLMLVFLWVKILAKQTNEHMTWLPKEILTINSRSQTWFFRVLAAIVWTQSFAISTLELNNKKE